MNRIPKEDVDIIQAHKEVERLVFDSYHRAKNERERIERVTCNRYSKNKMGDVVKTERGIYNYLIVDMKLVDSYWLIQDDDRFYTVECRLVRVSKKGTIIGNGTKTSKLDALLSTIDIPLRGKAKGWQDKLRKEYE